MSEMVEIKAELLKWCPDGFEFRYEGERGGYFRLKEVGARGGVTAYPEMLFQEHGQQTLFQECTVKVNAKGYEKAVIERIKEMIPTITCLIKDSESGYMEAWSVIVGGFGETMNCHCVIDADPRPHEDEYTIEVKQ